MNSQVPFSSKSLFIIFCSKKYFRNSFSFLLLSLLMRLVCPILSCRCETEAKLDHNICNEDEREEQKKVRKYVKFDAKSLPLKFERKPKLTTRLTSMPTGVNFINVFTYEFFVRTSFQQLFLVTFLTLAKKSYKKCPRKMLMKSTTVFCSFR